MRLCMPMVKMYYDDELETAAKQHDLICLWHVNPAQSKEVTWYQRGTTLCLQHEPMPTQNTF